LAWQIIEGVEESGISVFQPDDGVDTGPVYLQKGGVPISPIDNTASLYFDKLYPIGVEAMVETVAAIDAGTARLSPQREEGASFQGLVDEEAARLDLGEDVVALDRRIRGCDPQPGGWLTRGDERIRLYGSRVESQSEPAEAPGSILAVVESGLLLAARGGVLRIQKVRRAAGKSAAHESGLEVGDRLV
jgi:methionyl-tRNA formyltransferase